MSSANMIPEKENIEGVIFKQLKDWTRGEKRKSIDEKRMRHLKYVVRKFLESECNAPRSTVERSHLYTGEDGWYCGLAQMLNLKEGIICKTLPYTLTAYMYNYNIPKKKFVREFASKKKDTIDEDEFFGIKLCKMDNRGSLGIEDLLAGAYTIEGNSDLKVLERLAQCFTFSGVAVYGWDPEKEGKGIHIREYFDQRYVLPTGDGHDVNMNAAKQRIVYKEVKGQEPLPTLGDDSFIYGKPRDIPSIEDALDQLSRDLADFYEKATHVRGEEERRKAKEQLLNLSFALSQIKGGVSDLQARVDEIDQNLNELAKEKSWKKHKYVGVQNPASENRKNFSGGMSMDSVLNIFATWYHIWKKMYRKSYMACRVDPVQCVLLLKATLPEKETSSFEDFRQALEEMGQEKAWQFVDDLIEARHYELIRKDSSHLKTIDWTLDEFLASFPEPKGPYPNLTGSDT